MWFDKHQPGIPDDFLFYWSVATFSSLLSCPHSENFTVFKSCSFLLSAISHIMKWAMHHLVGDIHANPSQPTWFLYLQGSGSDLILSLERLISPGSVKLSELNRRWDLACFDPKPLVPSVPTSRVVCVLGNPTSMLGFSTQFGDGVLPGRRSHDI